MSAAPAVSELPSVAVADELPWAQWMDGLWVKLLRVSEATGVYVLMVQFSPGTELPVHRHFGQVHAYTLQGSWRYLEYDWVATAGSFVYEPPGSTHTLRAEGSEEDTIVLFTIQGGLVVFGPDGTYWAYEDAHTAKQRYLMALEQQGKVDVGRGDQAPVDRLQVRYLCQARCSLDDRPPAGQVGRRASEERERRREEHG
jgi:2,4'-dihydroxyacetophenone dioxygenase